MSASLTVPAGELAKLPRALRAIAAAAVASARTVIMGEAGVILKACAGQTKVATSADAQLRAQHRMIRDLGLTGSKKARLSASHAVTINTGAKADFGRVFLGTLTGRWRRTHDANFRRVPGLPSKGRKKFGDHYAADDWILLLNAINTVRAKLRPAREAGKRTIGLARQSWVQIADTLGIRLESVRGGGGLSPAGIAKARAALSGKGQRYQNGLSREEKSAGATLITLINRYPAGKRIGMDRTLASVLIGRIRYFERNVALGVFNSIQKTVRAYPYLTVKNK